MIGYCTRKYQYRCSFCLFELVGASDEKHLVGQRRVSWIRLHSSDVGHSFSSLLCFNGRKSNRNKFKKHYGKRISFNTYERSSPQTSCHLLVLLTKIGPCHRNSKILLIYSQIMSKAPIRKQNGEIISSRRDFSTNGNYYYRCRCTRIYGWLWTAIVVEMIRLNTNPYTTTST